MNSIFVPDYLLRAHGLAVRIAYDIIATFGINTVSTIEILSNLIGY